MKKSTKRVISSILVLTLVIGLVSGYYRRTTMKVKAGETNGVESKVEHAATEKYKDMDYTFLKDFSWGYAENSEVNVIFETVFDMQNSSDQRLREGNKIRTAGYYEVGDGGGAVYHISSSQSTGGIELLNGLYANIIADRKEIGGETWALVSTKQLGSKGDGVTPDNVAIGNAAMVASGAAASDDVFRAITYIPEGEYKAVDMIRLGVTDVNIVGEGDNTVIFTDNDYRKELGYSEFFIEVWGGNNSYFGDFTVEAREVDLYHYMRQFVLVYSTDIFVFNVDLIVPQEAYSAYYYEDKQYSNFCCYTGNKNVTVDGCKFVQMSGTYRGANVGVLDIWSAGEENIVFQNCDMYGNARDEQIGVFSTYKESAHCQNVEFINNNVYFYQPKYVDVVGNATMRITVAYTDSHGVDNIRFAGNHFVAECDSKFMTFGNVTNCVIEDNIIEVYCTYTTWSMVFDSSNGDNDNIHVKNNEFFITTDCNTGKGNIIGGKLTFENNRVFSDTILAYGCLGNVVNGNEFILLDNVAKLVDSPESFCDNKAYIYGSLTSDGFSRKSWITMRSASEDGVYKCDNNEVYYYRQDGPKLNIFQNLCMLDSNIGTFYFTNNKYYAPNSRFNSSENSADVAETDSEGNKYYDNRLFRQRGGAHGSIYVTGNTLQGTKVTDVSGSCQTFVNENNTYVEPAKVDFDKEIVSRTDIEYGGNIVTEITTTEEKVDLSALTYVASERDDEGNITSEVLDNTKEIKWYSSVEGLANVSESGVVTRNKFGEVHIFAVPLDGSDAYGEVVIHFEEAKANDIVVNKSVLDLQPGYRMYADYTVTPSNACKDLVWSSADESIATVSQSGLIEAKALGTTVITGTTMDGTNISKQITVNVTEITVKRITLNKNYYMCKYAEVGNTVPLSVSSYYPNTAVNQTPGRWESSDESIVKVDQNGLVTIVSNGIATISCYSTDEQCKGSCTFYIAPHAPEELTYSATKDSVRLEWSEVKNCYGYFIYQLNETTGEYDVLNNGNAVTYTNYTAKGLEAGKEYTFKVVPYIAHYVTGTRVVYEGDGKSIAASTYAYTPVTSIWCNTNPIERIKVGDTKSDIYFNYSPSDADYPNLSFTCETDDENVAVITEVKKDENTANKYWISVKGTGVGTTKLRIKANDSRGEEKVVSVGVFPAGTSMKFNTISAEVEYRKLTLTFEGLDDESAIAGYMVRRTQSMMFRDFEFVPKKGIGSSTYTYIQTDNIKDGDTYRYTVVPVLMNDEGEYFRLSDNIDGISVTFPELIMVESIEANADVYNVPLGTDLGISAKFSPTDADYEELIFTIMNSKVAYVSRDSVEGNVNYATITGKKVGVSEVEIAAADDSNVKEYVKVVISPQKINSIIAQSSLNSIDLSWDKIDGASGYYVYKYNASTTKWEKIADVSDSRYINTGLKKDTTYKYKVLGYITDNGTKYEGAISDEVVSRTMVGTFDTEIAGYSGVYDGESHPAVSFIGAKNEGSTYKFSVDYTSWTNEIPTVKDVNDSKVIYVKEINSSGTEYITSVTAKVTKAAVPGSVPSGTINVNNGIRLVGNVSLISNWAWQAGEGEKEITAGGSVDAVAEYVGIDKDNYENIIANIRITRAACNPENYTLINYKEADCENKGYTGDYICTECNEVVQTGSDIDALGHLWDEGVVVTEPEVNKEGLKIYTCERCDEEKEEVLDALEETTTEQESSSQETTTTEQESSSQETTTTEQESSSQETGTTEQESSSEEMNVGQNGSTGQSDSNDTETTQKTDSGKETSKNESTTSNSKVETGDNTFWILIGILTLGMIAGNVYIFLKKRNTKED